MKGTAAVILTGFGLFLLQHWATSQFLEPDCGLTGIANKITYGQDAVHGSNPWMAYIYRTINQSVTEFVCGGTLIHKQLVLTAAHCILKDEILAVRLGAYYSQSNTSTSMDYAVNKAFRNKLFNRTEQHHDIGILRVEPDVQFTAYIRPICIFTDPTKMPNVRTFRAAGWGKTENEKIARVLQILEVNELEPSECYDALWTRIIDGQICAGHRIGDTCLGDSGGPLVHPVHIGGQVRYIQLGIVSFGSAECRSPGVYTRVSKYIDWILKVVDNYTIRMIEFRRAPDITKN
ncbi:CLIP domain-containing serine protease B15 [Drosophila rhopaloa]|uniref:Chymotrypsin-like protease CTRL-1 n=1 Tax=Drosophila rhopaloa TaxID=1041015 RepID=A0A6P4F4J8_DRORH|nr:CLIP domain-containing serine protease B15 [Drosophila rhopaloa]